MDSETHRPLKWQNKYRIFPWQYDEIRRLYLEGQSHKQIGACFGVSKRTIAAILKRLRVKPRGHQLYQYRTDFFSTIDSPAKAYFLGLMFTDGTIDRNERVAKITLQDRDAYILDRFATEVFLDKRPPLYQDDHDYHAYGGRRRRKRALKMSCCPLVQDLMRLGCVPNKSLILRFPAIILKDVGLLWHFIRGLIDGDGCLSRAGGHFIVSYTGSNAMVKALNLILGRLGVKSYHHVDGRIRRLRIAARSRDSFLARLYIDSMGLRLERKYLVFNPVV